MAARLSALFCVFCMLIALVVSKGFVKEVRQNFEDKSNNDLTAQVAAFQRASLAYLAYASYFDRGDVHLPGFRKLFLAASENALERSSTLIDYVNSRGGHLQFPIINMNEACKMIKPSADLTAQFPNYTPQICRFVEKRDSPYSLKDKTYSKKGTEKSRPDDWQSGLMALRDALLVERALNEQLLHLTAGAKSREDHHLRQMVEDNFLGRQTERIKKLADVIKRLALYTEADYPLGEYVTDLEIGSI